jgi:hypothetical protein
VVDAWLVAGELRIGNHAEADVILPENRAVPGQAFHPVDYFQLRCRGPRAWARRLGDGERWLRRGGAEVDEAREGEPIDLEVLRRDIFGDEDLRIRLRLEPDPTLPDPRAWALRLQPGDRMVQAMFTWGLPRGEPRRVQLGPQRLTLRWADDALELTDFLEDYRLPDGRHRPLFVRRGGGPLRAAPEDGQPVRLGPGDQLLVGVTLLRVEVDG